MPGFQHVTRSGVAADEGFEQGVAGQTIGSVQAGAGDFAGSMQTGHGGASAHIGGDSAAEIVFGGDDGDGLAGHVETELLAGGINVWEALLQKFGAFE